MSDECVPPCTKRTSIFKYNLTWDFDITRSGNTPLPDLVGVNIPAGYGNPTSLPGFVSINVLAGYGSPVSLHHTRNESHLLFVVRGCGLGE